MPAGAIVYVDGQLVAGKTPMTVALTDDDYHALRVEKPGYETVHAQAQARRDGALPPVVPRRRRRQPRGTLFVDAAGPAEVWIDGQYSGFMTPTPGLRVTAGEHARRAARRRRARRSTRCARRCDQGDTARLTLQLAPRDAGAAR